VAKQSNRDRICADVVRQLVEERKRQGISGNSLAERSGLSQSLISSMETSSWNPTLDTLLRIAEVLNIDLGGVITKAQASGTRSD
jgi:transcriptional regulator with XRE-family HTH domain